MTFTGFEIIELFKFEFIFKILLPVFYLSHERGSIRAYLMPVSFLALARTLSLNSNLIVYVTTRSFLDSHSIFLFRSLKSLIYQEKSSVSTLFYTSTFAIMYDFARNFLFLMMEYYNSSRGLRAPPCFSHVLGCSALLRDRPDGPSLKFAGCFL